MTALVTFGIYMLGVFALAWLANRAGRGKSFASEYFLGSKNIGLWAFAFTYAATVASGGTFMGFPALIYTHGWALAWWVAGYMISPMIALGLMAKRLNQVGRIAGAITVPELLRRRFESGAVGNLATFLVVFFMFFYLMAQFKAGAEIMATLLKGVGPYESAVVAVERLVAGIPWVGGANGDYLLCLFVFSLSVILYTTFGGFRAVVWTDVMQGLVMAVGVVLMLVFALVQTGGLRAASERLAEMTPPRSVEVRLERAEGASGEVRIPRGSWIALAEEDGGGVVRLKTSASIPAAAEASEPVEALEITTPREREGLAERIDPRLAVRARAVGERIAYAYGDGEAGVYLRAPGPSRTSPGGFLGVMLAISFFAFWNFSGAGQPSYMVRQMAFRDTGILRRSMVMIALYFALTYFSLIVIFTCARVLLPGMETEADRVMPETASLLTRNAGVPWLAGLLVAAPFAAVMSSVDSFLLLVSSGVVRDIYQQSINPKASEQQVKRLSYLVTLVVGLLGTIAVIRPPQFLQDLIIFASAGLGACFLVPMVFALYWARTTAAGMVAGMLAGGSVVLVLYYVGYALTGKFQEHLLLGLHPFVWSVPLSALALVSTSLAGRPPAESIRRRFFGRAG
jgi:sodium/pantothenate symporter